MQQHQAKHSSHAAATLSFSSTANVMRKWVVKARSRHTLTSGRDTHSDGHSSTRTFFGGAGGAPAGAPAAAKPVTGLGVLRRVSATADAAMEKAAKPRSGGAVLGVQYHSHPDRPGRRRGRLEGLLSGLLLGLGLGVLAGWLAFGPSALAVR